MRARRSVADARFHGLRRLRAVRVLGLHVPMTFIRSGCRGRAHLVAEAPLRVARSITIMLLGAAIARSLVLVARETLRLARLTARIVTPVAIVSPHRRSSIC